jgi:replicative DNA helicase
MQALPHDTQIEKMLIGAIVFNPVLKGKIQSALTPDDFYAEDHKHIFEAISKAKPDIGSIVQQIKKRHNGKAEGLVKYVLDLAEETGTSAGTEHYVEIIKDLSTRRKIAIACMDVNHRIHDVAMDTNTILSELKDCIRDANNADDGDYRTNVELLNEVFKDIEYRKDNGIHNTGILCGIPEIDNNIGGFEGKTLTYLMARPSMGKTALSLNMAENMAMSDKGMVVFYSLEMGDTQIMRRRLSAVSSVALTSIRKGNIADSQWPFLIEASNKLADSRMIVVDKPKYKAVENLVSLTHTIAMEHQIGCVYVDHIQLMRSIKAFQSRHLEISHISNELKSLAKDLAIPVIVLSQLNREVEKRRDKHPVLSDLKESGDLEQDADNVIGLYREDPQNERMELGGLKGRDTGTWVSALIFDRFTQKTKTGEIL